MPKRSAALSKSGFSVGLEYDLRKIRGARVSLSAKGTFGLDKVEELPGDFSEESALVEGLRQMKDKLGMGARDTLVTCIGGKQILASQITFRKLPDEEMSGALRLELRKSLPFDAAGSTLDWQALKDSETKETDQQQVLVALTGGGLLTRHLKALEKAGLKPASVDVLPIAVANALWTWVDQPREHPHVVVHIGPSVSTVVIDGVRSPFFTRSVYFPAEDVFGKDPMGAAGDKRIVMLAEEIARSLAFYEKSAFGSGFIEVVLLGEHLEGSPLADQLRRLTGIPMRRMDIPKKMGGPQVTDPGRFDLALSLAMRGDA